MCLSRTFQVLMSDDHSSDSSESIGELPTDLDQINEGAGVEVVDPSAIAPFCLEPPEYGHYLVDAETMKSQELLPAEFDTQIHHISYMGYSH